MVMVLITGEEDHLGTDPLNSDTDYDSLPDDSGEVALGTDPLSDDSDGDDVTDDVEIEIGTDPLDADSDDDGLLDGKEVSGTDPLDADSDTDGFTDGEEVSASTNPLDQHPTPNNSPARRLETPAAGSPISGKGLISGWHCTAQTIEVSLNSGARISAQRGQNARIRLRPVETATTASHCSSIWGIYPQART